MGLNFAQRAPTLAEPVAALAPLEAVAASHPSDLTSNSIGPHLRLPGTPPQTPSNLIGITRDDQECIAMNRNH